MAVSLKMALGEGHALATYSRSNDQVGVTKNLVG